MAPRSTHATLECEIDSEQDCLSFTNKTVMSTSPGSSIDSVEERQRTNATLESMMLDFYSDDGDAEYFPAEGDSQDDDDDEDDDEDLDPDFIEDDDFVDDDECVTLLTRTCARFAHTLVATVSTSMSNRTTILKTKTASMPMMGTSSIYLVRGRVHRC